MRIVAVLTLTMAAASVAVPAAGRDAGDLQAPGAPKGLQGPPVTLRQTADKVAQEIREADRDGLDDWRLAEPQTRQPKWAPRTPWRSAIPPNHVLVEVLHSMRDADAKAIVAATGGTVTGSVDGSLVEAVMRRSAALRSEGDAEDAPSVDSLTGRSRGVQREASLTS